MNTKEKEKKKRTRKKEKQVKKQTKRILYTSSLNISFYTQYNTLYKHNLFLTLLTLQTSLYTCGNPTTHKILPSTTNSSHKKKKNHKRTNTKIDPTKHSLLTTLQRPYHHKQPPQLQKQDYTTHTIQIKTRNKTLKKPKKANKTKQN